MSESTEAAPPAVQRRSEGEVSEMVAMGVPFKEILWGELGYFFKKMAGKGVFFGCVLVVLFFFWFLF